MITVAFVVKIVIAFLATSLVLWAINAFPRLWGPTAPTWALPVRAILSVLVVLALAIWLLSVANIIH